MWMPGHLMQHSITLLLGQIALTQPRGVMGHCPVEIQLIKKNPGMSRCVQTLSWYYIYMKYKSTCVIALNEPSSQTVWNSI